MVMSLRLKSRSLPMLEAALMATLAAGVVNRAWCEETEPGYRIGLEETIARAIERDKQVLKHKAEWLSDSARMNEIEYRGGWNLELLGRDEGTSGERRELRDISEGRASRDARAGLSESERFIEFGLVREFWEEERQRRSDISDERLGQLDRAAEVMLDLNDSAERAANAFLQVYFGGLKRDLLSSQFAHEEENLRALEARLAHEEILEVEVLDARARLAELRRDLMEIDLAQDRYLDYLRFVWETPALESGDLGEPSVREASRFEVATFEELLDTAIRSRFDYRASEAALEIQKAARGLTPSKPELEFGVAGRYGNFDRDFDDEGREESTFDLRFELGLNVPLSLSKRNEFRMRRHDLLTQARVYDLESLRDRMRREVRLSQELYQLAKETVKIEELKVAKQEEEERILRLTALTMPETLATSPEAATREAAIALLDSRVALLEAVQEEKRALIQILAAVGRLAPSIPVDAANPSFKEN